MKKYFKISKYESKINDIVILYDQLGDIKGYERYGIEYIPDVEELEMLEVEFTEWFEEIYA